MSEVVYSCMCSPIPRVGQCGCALTKPPTYFDTEGIRRYSFPARMPWSASGYTMHVGKDDDRQLWLIDPNQGDDIYAAHVPQDSLAAEIARRWNAATR